MASVTLKDIVKTFKTTTVVDRLNIEIQDREFAVLVGPSGCGKTTALRMIAGLEQPTSGDILIGDRVVNDVPPKDRDIAMVFQNYALYPHMNVRENLGFGLKMRKFPKPEIDRRVEEAADILGIQGLLERKPRELSGGQRQRVAVGRAIVRKPAVFLFDEPLSNLDAKLRVAMRAEISRLHQRMDATTIYVTHDQVEAMTMAHRIYVMKSGTLQQQGAPMDIYRHPANRFVASFIGSPAMNFAEGVVENRDGRPVLNAGAFRVDLPEALREALAPYAGKPLVFGIRPEDFTLAESGQALGGDRISATADVVEQLGSEVLLHLSAGEHRLVARLDVPPTPIVAGSGVTVRLDASRARLFDPGTGLSVG
ncbi:sn-glycerol-3-phosphate import ATP-binding protein UgpC [Fundidesulfovibrio magnetotacticus]|uniref:sn-glycerol-3-phosphate import ATP-binding protein UgpC n=1 Tax=Fundidesulfovibrio magnetotacticus TaxID=2730080 RepID=A0A6V8LTX4_9BACT|nr:sn-glycerol-3-phosphate ABC transporter ATP-binding protein UgpC [Fundidesulfovibrio magnetotacticus]GFK94390.1 sn-glycerol-3-phosphate import ATP-binding protein UgpC [Fundidesulfovibrio magnetotacticus]